jgi:hypothetical protein
LTIDTEVSHLDASGFVQGCVLLSRLKHVDEVLNDQQVSFLVVVTMFQQHFVGVRKEHCFLVLQLAKEGDEVVGGHWALRRAA